VPIVLMDERAGRSVARTLGLRPLGVLGVLIKAKASGRLPFVLPLLDALEEGARFRVSESLRADVARLTGEIGGG